MTPLVSLIIVTYNASNDITDCLSALEKQTFTNFEILIVDNHSSDNTLDILHSLKTPFTLIPLNENKGFTGGNNEGLKHAKGKYIALLNPDTVPHKDWLNALYKEINTHPEVGICASKLLIHGTTTIDSAGDGFSTFLRGYKRDEGKPSPENKQPKYVFGACAGAAMYRKTMLDEIGFFDDNFFLIYEDTDLNFRAQLHGWKTLYIPTAIVKHKVRSSLGKNSDLAIYYSIRNSAIIRIKNIPCMLFLRHLPTYLLGNVLEFLYFAVKQRKLKIYLQAKWSVLSKLPMLYRQRTTLMKKSTISKQLAHKIVTPTWDKHFIKTKLHKLFYG